MALTPDDGDLDRAVLGDLLGERPLRTFPAMMSTEAEALRWAREGAVAGSVVVAGYQASPRGRSGLSYATRFAPGRGLGCSLVVRPELLEDREGWLYPASLLGVLDGLRADGSAPDGAAPRPLEWPDRIVAREGITEHDATIAAIGVHAEPLAERIVWAVITVLVPDLAPPRGPTLARVLAAIEARLDQGPNAVLDAFRPDCATLGRRVAAQILPMGPASPSFVGVAEDLLEDGGLRIATDDGARVVVRPQMLGFLEDPDAGPVGPPGIG